MVNVGVVGLGYWGPNVIRNLVAVGGVNITAICDLETSRAEEVRHRFCPQARVVGDFRLLADDAKTEAVVIVTPIRTHFELGSFFLQAGKHVLIEKPLACTVEECRRLIALAEKQQRVLMVGHVFEYNLAVRQIKQYLEQGELGRLFYVYSQRVNLGRIQSDVNALWSFAPHDVSILNYWLDSEPVWVTARGFSYLNNHVEDVIFVTLEYPGGVGVHLHLAWLDPRKVRLMTLVGSKKMLVYDDVSLDSKIQIYDKGIANLDEYLESPTSFAQFQFQIRSGDILIPSLQFGEALQIECRHFIDCIEKRQRPLSDGWTGLKVVKVLEAAERSLREGGRVIQLQEAVPNPE